MNHGRILFITGTDTAVGKTVLSVLLTRVLLQAGVRATALKPVASGGRGDALALYAAQDARLPLKLINPWFYRAPVAPVLAARRERRPLRLDQVVDCIRRWTRQTEVLVVEGAGGLLSPLGEDFDSRDLICALRAIPLIVCPNRLGCVNQARLALAALPPAARRRSVVVLNHPRRPDAATRQNAALLEEWEPGTAVLTLPWCGTWNDPAGRITAGTRRALQALLLQTIGT